MLLTFDIGNTNIVIGGFDGRAVVFEFRLKTDTGRTLDEYAALLLSLLDQQPKSARSFRAAVVTSVVPAVTSEIVHLVERQFNLKPLVIGPGVKTGLSIKTADPSAVGADKVVNAVAVKTLFGHPAIIVDFGTATSLDYLGRGGDYEGSVIAPGPLTALDSLVRHAAKLQSIELAWPKQVVGKNTAAAMQSGLVIGYSCLVDGLVDKIIEEVGPVEHVIATGATGQLMSEHSKRIRVFEPQLTLKGMQLVAEINGLV